MIRNDALWWDWGSTTAYAFGWQPLWRAAYSEPVARTRKLAARSRAACAALWWTVLRAAGAPQAPAAPAARARARVCSLASAWRVLRPP